MTKLHHFQSSQFPVAFQLIVEGLCYARVPLQTVRELGGSILNVYDPTMPGTFGSCGGVKRQRTHHHDATTLDRTDYFGDTCFPVVELLIQPTKPMGAGEDAKRTIVRPTIVKVDSYRDHTREYFCRRLHLPNACLLRPPDISWQVKASRHSDDIVLVPE